MSPPWLGLRFTCGDPKKIYDVNINPLLLVQGLGKDYNLIGGILMDPFIQPWCVKEVREEEVLVTKANKMCRRDVNDVAFYRSWLLIRIELSYLIKYKSRMQLDLVANRVAFS